MLIAAVLIVIMLAGVLYRRTQPEQPARQFLWPLGGLATWIITLILAQHVYALPEATPAWSLLAVACSIVALGVGLLWFFLTFPTRMPAARWTAIAAAFVGIAWIGLLLVFWTSDGALHAPAWLTAPALHHAASGLLACCGLSLALRLLVAPRVRHISRIQSAYTTVGLLLGIGGLMIDAALLLPVASFITPGYGVWGLVLFAGLVVYAVTRTRLYSPMVLFGSMLPHAIIFLFLAYIFSSVVAVSNRYLAFRYGMPHVYGTVLLAFSFSVLYPAILVGLRYVLDRTLLRASFTKQRALQHARDAFSNLFESPLLAGALAYILGEVLHPRSCHVYLCDGKDTLTLAYPAQETSQFPLTLRLDDAVPAFLLQRGSAVFTEELLGGDNHRSVGETLQHWEVALAVPLCVKQTCYGLVLLGEKCTELGYTLEDLSLLKRIARDALPALERARRYDQLRAANAQLTARIDQQGRQLHKATTQLRLADLAKDHFLATLSHELRTPLTAILGWTEMAKDDGSPQVMARAIDVIQLNAERQQRLVSDLMDASRISYGKLAIHCEPVDLWALAEQAAQDFIQHAAEKRLTLTLQPPHEPLWVSADAMRLVQVIENLLSNAVKFTDAGGEITVTASGNSQTVTLQVRDTGCGIPAEILSSIFDPFQQARDHRNGGGLGIGLALAKGIMDLHDGQVIATSSGEGQGSTFTLVLPSLAHPLPLPLPESRISSVSSMVDVV
jgi:signal transduction histidine kinase